MKRALVVLALALAAWQVVQVELFTFFAIAGFIEKSRRECGVESGPGE